MNYIFCVEGIDVILDILGITTDGLLPMPEFLTKLDATKKLAHLINVGGKMKVTYIGGLKREASENVSELWKLYYFVEAESKPKGLILDRLLLKKESELVDEMGIFGYKSDRDKIIQTHLFLLVEQRCAEMLKDSRIQKLYATEEANYGKEQADNWLIKTAMATLYGIK